MLTRASKVHIGLTAFWALMMVPTILFFKDSVLWVSIVSIYALVASHWSAYEAAQAGVHRDTLRQIRAVTDALAQLMTSYQEDQPDDELASAIEELQASLAEEQDKR